MSTTTASAAPRRSRRLLVPLATMLVAGAVVAGSGATFTSTTSSTASVVTAGAFTQTNTAEGAAVFTMEKAKPGDAVPGTATVTNTGDFAGDFTLVEQDADNTFPAGDLDLVVTDTTGPESVVVYNGDLGSLGSETLGTLQPGEARTYDFVVTIDAAAENDAQGATATATYVWEATQTADADEA